MAEKTIVSNRFDGKTAVITGGASGIGLATGRRLAAEGAKVVIGDLDEVKGPQVADELGGLFVKVNVTDEEQVKNLFQQAKDTYGSVDVAFNNAGINPTDDSSILDTGLDAWSRVQNVNSRPCTCALSTRSRTWSSRSPARSSTRPRSSRSWGRRRRRSRTRPRRAVCCP